MVLHKAEFDSVRHDKKQLSIWQQKPLYIFGWVANSNSFIQRIASSCDSPHISTEGCKVAQKAGRSGRPKIAQRLSSVSCTQRTPAGLPFGMPGKGEVIEGAIQQAAQLGRQFIYV